MSNECCKQFCGWCKSFTRSEILLALLEVLLLVVFFVFFIFLVIHLIVCKSLESEVFNNNIKNDTQGNVSIKHIHTTVGPDVECTWKQSEKTEAVTHYYELGQNESAITEAPYVAPTSDGMPVDIDDLTTQDQSDGEDADEKQYGFVLALVRIKPNRGITFGCILTAISEYWTVTAASCLESIEEVDSLDSFVMMEGYGGTGEGKTHAVADVEVHGLYQGANRSYDLAALKSEDKLRGGAVKLPTAVDYFLVTIGERFKALGYGPFRTISERPAARPLRWVYVYSLGAQQCREGDAEGDGEARGAGGGGGWSLRHLVNVAPLSAHRPCAARPLCAGVLQSRGTPCQYCAGTPLVRGATLWGVMAAAAHCGALCEPAHIVALPAPQLRRWLLRLRRRDPDPG